MRDPGRIAAAIEILDRFKERPAPLSVLVADWGRSARYAGSKDRAFVRGLCLDALRRWKSFGGLENTRIAVLLTLRAWGWNPEQINEAFAGEHGPGALTDVEAAAIPSAALDLPEAVLPHIVDAAVVSEALASRAPVDLRANGLKADVEKALKALKTLGAVKAPLSPMGLRIPPASAADKGPGVTVIPAFGKGWVEVQDEGSQLTALVAGGLHGKQVLDYCAGGGGKTLALSAGMNNSGQVFAYDASASRLTPIHERLRRAGARNVQVIAPSDPERLQALSEKMDLVFVDAPCSGSGTWRRHPDAKWRMTASMLEQRLSEQDEVLRQAATFVKPGGALLFVTCSFLPLENDERVASFIKDREEFTWVDPLTHCPPDLRATIEPFSDQKALRLSPWTSKTDGFTLIRLEKALS